MLVDCDRCEVRGTACGDCVIGVLMNVPEIDRPIPYLPVDLSAEVAVSAGGPVGGPVEFAEPERRALQVLADHGLIPHLRLVEPARPGPGTAADRPMLPVPAVPPRTQRHRDAG
ncbi:hypothetical protein [Pseudonocardia parietis]|uniref:Uncharacterized protein n=1 Tax=Pseudonocardia parietis TaxID=570936 RepID=A0ABS4W105_9PSEU|nr:hypothetical protein [Pseudonocardia parietis]MBP2369354.1 hypothetical protein [Pseudonocardia parietis]